MKKSDEKPIISNRTFDVEVVLAPLPPNEVFCRSERLKALLFQGAMKYAHNKEMGEKNEGV